MWDQKKAKNVFEKDMHRIFQNARIVTLEEVFGPK